MEKTTGFTVNPFDPNITGRNKITMPTTPRSGYVPLDPNLISPTPKDGYGGLINYMYTQPTQYTGPLRIK
jgi:hypothetical protein